MLKKKYLSTLIALNGHIGSLRRFKNLYAHNYYLYYRLNYVVLNLFKSFSNFNIFLGLFKSMILNNCKVLFICNEFNLARLIFFFTKKINQYCFVGSWVPGFFTNYGLLHQRFFLKRYKESKKNRGLFGLKDVNLISNPFPTKNFLSDLDFFFFFGSNQNKFDYRVLKEILRLKKPLLGVFNSDFKIERADYFFLVNATSINIYFIFILLIKLYKSLKNKYYYKLLSSTSFKRLRRSRGVLAKKYLFGGKVYKSNNFSFDVKKYNKKKNKKVKNFKRKKKIA